ncbi:dTDP-3-amino-3,6-dideoxy-alpha-D-galactopyranose transaminase [compost metagenome]
MQYMNHNQIQTLIHYPIPPHKQEAYKEWSSLSFPISEQIHSEIVSIPISPVLDLEDVRYISEAINEYQ